MILTILSSIIIFGVFGQNNWLQNVVEQVSKDTVLEDNIVWRQWAITVQELMVNVVWYWILLPIMVIVGILLALINFYTLLFSDKEEEQKKSVSRIVWWVIGILLMGSALFIASNFANRAWDLITTNPSSMVTNLYDNVIAWFLKIWLYLAPVILFIMLVVQVYKFLFNPSEEVKAKAWKIIIWNIFGIIVILGATFVVELIMGPRMMVTSYTPTVWDVWLGIFAAKPWLFLFIVNLIKLLLSVTAFFILVIIIYQAYLLLFKPEDEEWYKKIKRNFLYVLIWSGVIFTIYMVVNFLILK